MSNADKKRKTTIDGTLAFSEKTAAKRLGVSYMTMFRRRRDGLVPYYRVGSRVLYDDSCLAEFLKRSRVA